MSGFKIADARVRHERAAIARPVKNSFGTMRERHAVLLLLTDDRGHTGVGESWINFPLWAAWEREAAFAQTLIPYLIGRPVDEIPAFVAGMYRAFLGPAQQSGTAAPLVQALCAVELALWDLSAQRAGVPLAHHLFAHPSPQVRVYASGINSPLPWDAIEARLDLGVALFKLKLGFGDDEDRRNLEELVNRLGSRAAVAVDVNRGWTLAQAQSWMPLLESHRVQWLEEPLSVADEPRLGELKASGRVPIAGGENLFVAPAPGTASDPAEAPFDIVQPDLTKNFPLHLARKLLDAAAAGPRRVIPHFLGSAPGQAASLQFAAGCPEGLVEMDINPNPLRTDLCIEAFRIVDGAVKIPDLPGIGWRLKP